MSAAVKLLADFHAQGVGVRLEGGSVMVTAPKGAVTDAQASILRQCKAEIISILEAANDRDLFEERAAIIEYDGNLPRDEAERLARTLDEHTPPAANTSGSTGVDRIGGLNGTAVRLAPWSKRWRHDPGNHGTDRPGRRHGGGVAGMAPEPRSRLERRGQEHARVNHHRLGAWPGRVQQAARGKAQPHLLRRLRQADGWSQDARRRHGSPRPGLPDRIRREVGGAAHQGLVEMGLNPPKVY